jgi:hypothetical protein
MVNRETTVIEDRFVRFCLSMVVSRVWKWYFQVVEVAVGRPSRMGGIPITLWVLGGVLYAFMDDIVIILAGSEALSSMLCFLINMKSGRDTGSHRAGHRLSHWEVYGASRCAAFWPYRRVALIRIKSPHALYVTKVLFTNWGVDSFIGLLGFLDRIRFIHSLKMLSKLFHHFSQLSNILLSFFNGCLHWLARVAGCGDAEFMPLLEGNIL